MTWTKNNHISYKIGNREFGFRNDADERYTVNIGSVNKDVYNDTSIRKESYKTAIDVANDLGDVTLMFSGGSDSEIVLRSFLQTGTLPNVVIIRFNNDYNKEDVEYAQEICRRLKVTPVVIDHNIDEFKQSNEMIDLALTVQCTDLAVLNVYFWIKKLARPSVIGGEVYIRKHASNRWYYAFEEFRECASTIKFSQHFNIPVVSEWFAYTPESLLKFLSHPVYHRLATTQTSKLSSSSSKNVILHNEFPEIEFRKKTHGFEKIVSMWVDTTRFLQSHMIQPQSNDINGLWYEDAIKRLRSDS